MHSMCPVYSKYFHPKSWKDYLLLERLQEYEPSLYQRVAFAGHAEMKYIILPVTASYLDGEKSLQ